MSMEGEDIEAEPEQFRAFLRRLGFSVRLWWQHDPEGRKFDRSAFEWKVSKQEIQVETNLENFADSATGSENSSDALSSRRSRVRNPDTG